MAFVNVQIGIVQALIGNLEAIIRIEAHWGNMPVAVACPVTVRGHCRHDSSPHKLKIEVSPLRAAEHNDDLSLSPPILLHSREFCPYTEWAKGVIWLHEAAGSPRD